MTSRAESAVRARSPFQCTGGIRERRCADAVQLAARSMGLSRLPASMAPSALPRPQSCALVDKQDDAALAGLDFTETALRRSSISPRYFAPAIKAPCRARKRSCRAGFRERRRARCAARALPRWRSCPRAGLADEAGVFFVFARRIRITLRISKSRPMTGRACSRVRAPQGRSRIF